jgi:hypothetical protein
VREVHQHLNEMVDLIAHARFAMATFMLQFGISDDQKTCTVALQPHHALERLTT